MSHRAELASSVRVSMHGLCYAWTPSCSNCARHVIERYGFFIGLSSLENNMPQLALTYFEAAQRLNNPQSRSGAAEFAI